MDIAKARTHDRFSLLENRCVQASIYRDKVVDCCEQTSQTAKSQFRVEATFLETSESCDEVLKATELCESSLPFLEGAGW